GDGGLTKDRLAKLDFTESATGAQLWAEEDRRPRAGYMSSLELEDLLVAETLLYGEQEGEMRQSPVPLEPSGPTHDIAQKPVVPEGGDVTANSWSVGEQRDNGGGDVDEDQSLPRSPEMDSCEEAFLGLQTLQSSGPCSSPLPQGFSRPAQSFPGSSGSDSGPSLTLRSPAVGMGPLEEENSCLEQRLGHSGLPGVGGRSSREGPLPGYHGALEGELREPLGHRSTMAESEDRGGWPEEWDPPRPVLERMKEDSSGGPRHEGGGGDSGGGSSDGAGSRVVAVDTVGTPHGGGGGGKDRFGYGKGCGDDNLMGGDDKDLVSESSCDEAMQQELNLATLIAMDILRLQEQGGGGSSATRARVVA
ncbi:unnamed protein product, partial [Discosporangium mesarthrocarpum]